MTAAEQPRRLGRRGRRVLDRLRLVEDHVLELEFLQVQRRRAERAVGGEDDVGVAVKRVALLGAPGAGVVDDAKRRERSARLRRSSWARASAARRRATDDGASGVGAAARRRLEQREHHDRLAEPHVVGEAAAESESPQELEPAERFALVVAERAAKRRRRIARLQVFAIVQRLTGAAESVVERHDRAGRLRVEQRVEQGHLRGAVAHAAVAGVLGRGDERTVFLQPVLGQHAERAVAERDDRLAAPEGFHDVGERRRRIAEVDGRLEIEPVDARRHFQADVAGGTPRPTFGFDVPPLRDERAHGARQTRRVEAERALATPVVDAVSRARLQHARPRRGFGVDAPPHPAPGDRVEDDFRPTGGDEDAAVVELEIGAEHIARASPSLEFREPQPRRRRHVDVAHPQGFRQRVGRHAESREGVKQVALVRPRYFHRPHRSEREDQPFLVRRRECRAAKQPAGDERPVG